MLNGYPLPSNLSGELATCRRNGAPVRRTNSVLRFTFMSRLCSHTAGPSPRAAISRQQSAKTQLGPRLTGHEKQFCQSRRFACSPCRAGVCASRRKSLRQAVQRSHTNRPAHVSVGRRALQRRNTARVVAAKGRDVRASERFGRPAEADLSARGADAHRGDGPSQATARACGQDDSSGRKRESRFRLKRPTHHRANVPCRRAGCARVDRLAAKGRPRAARHWPCR
jgi:hypothetical protein